MNMNLNYNVDHQMNGHINEILTKLKNEICGIMIRIQARENYGVICNQYDGYNKSMLDFIMYKNTYFFETWFGKIYNYLINPASSKQELEHLLTTELFHNRYLNHYVVDIIYDNIKLKKNQMNQNMQMMI